MANPLVYTKCSGHDLTGDAYISVKDEHGDWICDIVKRTNGANDHNVEIYNGATNEYDRMGFALSLRDAKKLAQQLANEGRITQSA